MLLPISRVVLNRKLGGPHECSQKLNERRRVYFIVVITEGTNRPTIPLLLPQKQTGAEGNTIHTSTIIQSKTDNIHSKPMKEGHKETTPWRDKKDAKITQRVRKLVFAASLLGLRRGRGVCRAGGSCVVGGSDSSGLSGGGSGLRLPKVLGQGFFRPWILFFGHTLVQELYQESSNGSGGENQENTGNPGRLTVDEAKEPGQVIQNPFTDRERMTSGVKRAAERRRGGVLAATRSKRAVPRLMIGVGLVLKPVPHGLDVKADLIRAEEPEGLAAIGQNHKLRCSARSMSGLV